MIKKRKSEFKRKRRIDIIPKKCYFCVKGAEPDYKDVKILRQFTSQRGKILPSTVTGVCRKHQNKLTKEVKRARMVALLPFTVK